MSYTLDGIVSPLTGARVPNVDPYGPAPLIDSLRLGSPNVYSGGLLNGPPPTAFPEGDLPPFTASGLDPKMLMKFPWQQRHAVAAMPELRQVYSTLETWGDQPDVMLPADALSAYIGAVRRWATDVKRITDESSADQTYQQIFGMSGGAA